MNETALKETIQILIAPGKGILAMDASTPTFTKRLEKIGIPSTEESRRSFRELLVTTPSLSDFIGGAILYDETLRQKAQGKPFTQLLQEKGILAGIKADMGAKEMANFPGEKISEGLDGLRERLAEYKGMGARFAKWRTIVTIGEGIPTRVCIDSNAHALARYAALCQEADIVPIVEPEVYMDGEHTIEQSEQITASVLLSVFAQLKEQKVNLSGILLKPNMVLSGYKCPSQASNEEVVETTIRTLLKTVPKEVPGIAFLSGGQDPKLATARLNEMCKRNDLPWKLTFSFERALEDPALTIWAGKEENVKNAQDMLSRRAKYNSLATKGQYHPELENE